jgi:mono/diheme cytochrome c family protein
MNGQFYLQVLVFLVIVLLTACDADGSAGAATSLEPTATVTPDPVTQGHQVFVRICAQCHGENAEGYANELNAPALDASEHAFHHPDQQIHDWIVNGKLGVGRQMPPLGDQLTDGEVHAVIDYLHTLWTEEQLTAQQDITSRWPATPEPTWTPQP